jgi:hypothetical protein
MYLHAMLEQLNLQNSALGLFAALDLVCVREVEWLLALIEVDEMSNI